MRKLVISWHEGRRERERREKARQRGRGRREI